MAFLYVFPGLSFMPLRPGMYVKAIIRLSRHSFEFLFQIRVHVEKCVSIAISLPLSQFTAMSASLGHRLDPQVKLWLCEC